VARSELTPLSFLERSAVVFPDRVAIVHGQRRLTYADFASQATRLANALRACGVTPGDRVAYLCPNIPELLVAHFGVPLAGAVLVASTQARERSLHCTTPAPRCSWPTRN
jgi:fatty-acyl-CoA synthase